MRTGNRRLWLVGLLLLCGASLSTRWSLGPAPAVQELRQRTILFPTRFPLRLTHSGTYWLLSDLAVQNRDADAIQILTGGTVLDLNGFTITGPHQGGTGRGVSTGDADRHYITVRNGTVCGFGGDSVQLPGLYQRVENVHACENGGDGIETRPHSVLLRNLVIRNGGSGINVSRGESLIMQNTIQGNHSHSINGGSESWVSDNLIEDNRGEGVFVTVGALVLKNRIRRSGRNGLLLGMFGTVEENEVQGSQEAGITTYGKSNRVIKNTVKGNQGPGAKLGGPDNYIARNIFQGNAATALTSAADDSVGRGEEANTFLLPSGEVDETGTTRRGERVGDAWSQ